MKRKTVAVYQKHFGNGERRLTITDDKKIIGTVKGEHVEEHITGIEIKVDGKKIKIDF